MASATSTPEPDTQDEDDPPADPTYLAHFSEHLNHVLSHLSGKDGSGAPPPSFFPPRAFWTSAEKEAFFHGLAVHSRLRPDLIAEAVKTKTVVDICVYLHALEEGARATPTFSRKDMPIAMEVSDRWVVLEEGKALALEHEEPEREEKALQDKRYEEVLSRRLTFRARKGRARTASKERDRDGEKERRKSFRLWLDEKKEDWKVEDALRALDLPTLKAMDRVLREGDEARWADEVQEAEKMQRAAYAAAEALQLAHGEHASFEAQEHPPVDEQVIDPVLRAESQGAPSMSASPGRSPFADGPSENAATYTNQALAPSHMLSHPRFQPSTPPFKTADLPSQLLDPSTPQVVCKTLPDEAAQLDDPHLSPASRRKLQKRMHMRKKRAEAKGAVVNRTMDKLKPGKKKTRRSVSLQENPECPVPQDENQEKEKVIGNSSQDRKNVQPVVEHSTDLQNATVNHEERDAGDQPSETEDDEPKRRNCASGTTLPYRLLSKLQSKGLDADKLHEEGLGLLHLGGLAKLMRLYNQLHDVPVSVGTQISAEVIRLLYAHVVNFTTQVMHRTIVSREQERLAKMNTKAWRLGGNQIINATNVNHALAMMGSQNFSKSAHFGDLLDRLGFGAQAASSEADESDAAEDEEGHGRHPKRRRRTMLAVRSRASLRSNDDDGDDDGNEDDSDIADEESSVSPNHSLHRTIFAPFIRLPSDLNSGCLPGRSNPLDVSSYVPWRPPSASTEPVADGDLMAQETDTDALLEELLEDEELDKRDRAIEEMYEKGLWAKFPASRSAHMSGEGENPVGKGLRSTLHTSRKRKRDELGSDGNDADDGAPKTRLLRFDEPDRFGPIKSQVYVVDSD